MRTPMKSYVVTWTIEIDAKDAHEAARATLEIQRCEESTAVVFDVKEVTRKRAKTIRIDFLESRCETLREKIS